MDKEVEQFLKLKKPDIDLILEALENYKLKHLVTDTVNLFTRIFEQPKPIELLTPEERVKWQKRQEAKKKRIIDKQIAEEKHSNRIDLVKAKIIVLFELEGK